MGNAEKIPVEVAYALPGKQVIVPLAVAPDATIEQVIRTSGIL
jgi:putative ubiquitin-RnfH superfamily antitoxin RatB of RatAB toxin-antitoxin module